jgi:hypothetical protein
MAALANTNDSVIGTWKRVDWPRTDMLEPIWLSLRFESNGHLTINYRPGNPYVGMLTLSEQEAALKSRQRQIAEFDILGSGKMRIEMDGSASTYTFEIKGNKLYLTPPPTLFGPSPSAIYLRST